MAPNGTIISYAYTSAGRIPLADVVVRIMTSSNVGKEDLINVQMTDRNGKTNAISIETPPAEDSIHPGNGRPFDIVTMTAELPGYEQIRVENVQVFPNTQTVQYFQLIPLKANPENVTPEELFIIPPQNL